MPKIGVRHVSPAALRLDYITFSYTRKGATEVGLLATRRPHRWRVSYGTSSPVRCGAASRRVLKVLRTRFARGESLHDPTPTSAVTPTRCPGSRSRSFQGAIVLPLR